jgi:hypothetical protein
MNSHRVRCAIESNRDRRPASRSVGPFLRDALPDTIEPSHPFDVDVSSSADFSRLYLPVSQVAQIGERLKPLARQTPLQPSKHSGSQRWRSGDGSSTLWKCENPTEGGLVRRLDQVRYRDSIRHRFIGTGRRIHSRPQLPSLTADAACTDHPCS